MNRVRQKNQENSIHCDSKCIKREIQQVKNSTLENVNESEATGKETREISPFQGVLYV